jgi:putative tryptophan/tyrosine transport system substrate-binding protein
MRRREVIALLGSAALAWPPRVRAQRASIPVIGFLNSASPDGRTDRLRAFRQGLRESGYVEGENVALEHRWADNQLDRLPALAADLVRRRVAVIVAGSLPPIVAAKASTTTTPIVFITAEDPVGLGLVTSLARPGGNLTGINFFNLEVAAKRLGLLRQLAPTAVRVALLVNPANARITEVELREVEPAARALGLQVRVLNADTSSEIDAAFATLGRERPDALFVGTGPFFSSQRVQLVQLAARLAIPASFGGREYAEDGGLMSYGASIVDAWAQAGVYAGRILKGAKPADLPVVQSTRFELILNLKTARALALEIPPLLLALADEVIE